MSPTDLRHLTDYLTEKREAGIMGSALVAVGRWVVPAVILALLYWFLLRQFTCLFFVAFFGVGQGLYQWIAQSIAAHSRRSGWQRSKLDARAIGAADELRDLIEKGNLHNRIHPKVGEALEGCAKLAMQIRTNLNGSAWKERSMGKHWQEVRQSSLLAVDEALHQAILLAMPYVRRSGMRKATFEKSIESDPYAGKVVEEIEELQTKLQHLSSGLADAVGREATETQLDRALRDLHAVRGAEKELDDEVQQRLNG
jgi:hypothetical protein